MVCGRCIEAVKSILLTKANLQIISIELGKVVINRDLTEAEKDGLAKELKNNGFELLHNKKQKIIEEIKSIIIHKIHHSDGLPEHLSFSDVISKKLNSDYKYLSSLFSSNEGITIEKYVILQKTEKIKELITYNQMNLSEIAIYMGYSSTAHICQDSLKTRQE
jgi:YesN/AraC family two-component response regulator